MSETIKVLGLCPDCQGTGEQDGCGPDHGFSTCPKHYCCNCEQIEDQGECVACNGKGRR